MDRKHIIIIIIIFNSRLEAHAQTCSLMHTVTNYGTGILPSLELRRLHLDLGPNLLL